MTRFMANNETAPRFIEGAVDAVMVNYSEGDQELRRPTRWLYVGQAGTLAVRMASGRTVSLEYLPYGAMLPVSVTAVIQAGSDANYVAALF